MKEFLSRGTQALIDKYENAKPIESINSIEICAIDKKDLEFFLGYTEESLRIESDLKDRIKDLESQLSELVCAIYEHVNEGTYLMELAEKIDETP